MSNFRPQLVTVAARPQASTRLYCIPHGGSGPSTYRDWAEALPETVELVAVELPGRADRADEPSHTDPFALAAMIADAVADENDRRPFALFGHSVGALLVYLAVLRLREQDGMTPALLAVSSFPAPHIREFGPLLAQFVAQNLTGMFDILGVPTEQMLRDDPEQLINLVTPLLADLVLVLQYKHNAEPPLDIPLSVFGGEQDPLVPAVVLHEWRKQSCTEPVIHMHPGGHLYVRDRGHEVVEELVRDLAAATQAE